jgi:hypothetical protein
MLHFMRLAAAAGHLLLVSPTFAAAEAPSAEEIMERVHHVMLYQGEMKRASVRMTITDANGNERRRQFYSLRLDKPSPEQEQDRGTGSQYFYIYFKRPGDIKRTAFLVHKHPDRDDDRWLYLPDLDLVKRIAAGDKRTSFVGSTFFYEDISGRSLTEDQHELISEDDTYFVVKSTPLNPGEVEFAYYKTWIHKTTFIPVQIEYFDDQGEKYRLCENKKVETIEGKPTVVKGLMHDLRRGEYTLVESSQVTYDLNLPEDVFTERYLRNPPNSYFR